MYNRKEYALDKYCPYNSAILCDLCEKGTPVKDAPPPCRKCGWYPPEHERRCAEQEALKNA